MTVTHRTIELSGIIPGDIEVFLADTIYDGILALEKEYDLTDSISRKEKLNPSFGTFIVVHHKDGSAINVVLENEKRIGTIAHEAVHVGWEILDKFDIKVTIDNHEALARAVQTIVDAIIKLYEVDNVINP